MNYRAWPISIRKSVKDECDNLITRKGNPGTLNGKTFTLSKRWMSDYQVS
jgi:hypothetical protein